MNTALMQDVISEVRRRMTTRATLPRPARAPSGGALGIYSSVDDAVAAATDAQRQLERLSLDDRDAIVKLIKKLAKDNARAWGEMEFAETKIGRLDHKIEK